MEKFKRAYYLFFYKLYQFFNSLSSDGWGDWKAGLVLQTLQYFILFIIILQIEIFTKNPMPNIDPKIWAIPLGIIIASLNYYIFIYKGKWKLHEKEFKNYSKQKNRIANLIIFSIILVIFLLLILSYYQLSQINWSK
jgi:Na+-driven multidrug efflux pump